MALANACPKPSRTRLDEKRERRAVKAKEMAACYRKVDQREAFRCRVTRVNVDPHTVSALERGHHHHMVYRSRGGAHHTNNVVLVSPKIHQSIHNGEMRLSGDADVVKGVLFERYIEGGWWPDKWV